MGRIIPLNGDEHREFQLLLPWFMNGTLESAEHARIEAQLTGCQECQSELEFERHLAVELSGLSDGAERGWSRVRRRLRLEGRRSDTSTPHDVMNPAPRTGGRWMGWAIAAQFILLLLASAALILPLEQPARYQTLESAPPVETGNMVVIFRPDTTEAELRQMLNTSNARLVGGPTVAGAYMLQVPKANRQAALSVLRESPTIVLAEPIDPGELR